MATREAPRRVEWRQLAIGAKVWAPVGSYGWRAAIVTKFGHNRGEHTICSLTFDASDRRTSPGTGKREARVLAWRRDSMRPTAPDRDWYQVPKIVVPATDPIKEMLDLTMLDAIEKS